jgi:ribose transport system substrate-binding protein
MNTKKVMLALLVTCTVVAFAAAGCAPAAPEKAVIGYSPHTFEATDFYAHGQTGLETKAEEIGLEVEVIGKAPATLTDAEGQIKIIEDFITSEVDYIWLVPVSVEAAPPMIEAANKAGIPIFISHSLEPYDPPLEVFSYVGTDFMKTGTNVGNWVVDNYGCDLKFAVVRGAAGQYDTWRVESAVEVLEDKCPNMEIIKSDYTDWYTENALNETATLLEAHPDIDLIYAPAAPITLGVVEAVEVAGLTESVDVLDYDLIPTTQKMCTEVPPKLVGGLAMFPFKYGEVVAELVAADRNGEEVPQFVEVDGVVVACGELDDVFPQWYRDLAE